jgi:hypothetical protein
VIQDETGEAKPLINKKYQFEEAMERRDEEGGVTDVKCPLQPFSELLSLLS